jgi:lactate dehydrogenase-like 2-hydroxyacid dehydrogenase
MDKLLFIYNVPLGEYADLVRDFELVRPAQPSARFNRQELLERIGDAAAILCSSDHPCDKEMIDAGKKLKVIGNVGVGYNAIDVAAASAKGVKVVNTPRGVTEPTAELTIALMLDCCRSVSRCDRELRASRAWNPAILEERDMVLGGRTLGVLGFGRIGQSVARRAALGLGMKIMYHDIRRADPAVEKELNAAWTATPEDVLRQADVITLHMPYTPENHHFINEARLALMKPTAYLVNAARGAIVSEEALVRALRDGVIRGAGLDVHEKEPTVSEAVTSLENIVLTPHVGTKLPEVRMQMFGEMIKGVLAVLRGEPTHNIVNP